jgi:1,4-alpha-glucan branching enzyme
MNPQTITTKANSSHFSHSDANRGEASRETVTKTPSAAASNSTKDGKKKSAAVAAKTSAAAAPLVQATQHSDTLKETTFKIEAAHAHEVLLAGCFTEWKKSPVKMVKGGGGVWHAKVNLKPGSYRYRFLVDGNWQNDPSHTNRVPNPYGSADMVLQVA